MRLKIGHNEDENTHCVRFFRFKNSIITENTRNNARLETEKDRRHNLRENKRNMNYTENLRVK